MLHKMDVLRIFDNSNLGSYYKFLVKYEPEYRIRVGEDEEKVIEFVSKKLANGKRIHELRLLKRMLTYTQGVALFHGLQTDLDHDYGIHMNQNQMENIVNVMTNKFPSGGNRGTYAECVFLEKDKANEQDYRTAKSFVKMLENAEFRDILKELVEFGINRYERDFSNTYRNTNFVLYQKYTYEDVCRLLNWERNEVPLNIGGYKFDKKTKTFPVFDSISKEFYYLGNMRASGKCREFIMPKTDKKAVEIEWLLDVPVREDIYEYIVNA